jgi:hypothetical protein
LVAPERVGLAAPPHAPPRTPRRSRYQLARTVGVLGGVGAGSEELGTGRGVAVGVDEGRVVVTGELAAVVGEGLALGVGNGFSGSGCLVCGC